MRSSSIPSLYPGNILPFRGFARQGQVSFLDIRAGMLEDDEEGLRRIAHFVFADPSLGIEYPNDFALIQAISDSHLPGETIRFLGIGM